MITSTEAFCHALVRSRLLTASEVRKLYHSWNSQQQIRNDDLPGFTCWLTSRHYLTPYQIDRLKAGQVSSFFFDRYKILDRIGHGTMAKVYKVVCPNGELFALKVLPHSRARNQRWLAMFKRAAREAEHFHHPNIVKMLSAGKTAGVHYLLMEYLRGETLEELLRRQGQLSTDEAIHVIYQALMGLEHIHSRGASHCNLEPAHLMLVKNEGVDILDTVLELDVKLLDVGLGEPLFEAQVGGAQTSHQPPSHVQFLGPVDELAPEWVAKTAGAGDIRSDIFSLGCIFYRCLMGRSPFSSSTTLDTLARLSTEDPAPLMGFVQQLPDGLDKVVLRMLAKDPAKRFPDPATVLEALRDYLPSIRHTGEIPIAHPVGTHLQTSSDTYSTQRPSLPHDRPPSTDLSWAESESLRRPSTGGWKVSTLLLLLMFVGILTGSVIYFSFHGLPILSDEKRVEAKPYRGNAPSKLRGNDFQKSARADLQKHKPKAAHTPGLHKKTNTPLPGGSLGEKDNSNGPNPIIPSDPKTPSKTRPTNGKNSETAPSTLPTPSTPRRRQLIPIPPLSEQEAATALIQHLYEKQYALRTVPEQITFAQFLLKQAKETEDDVTARFVLFREALRITTDVGNVPLAFDVVNEIDRQFTFDSHKERLEILTKANPKMRFPNQSQVLAEYILNTVQETIATNKYQQARDFLQLVEPIARRSPDRDALIRRVGNLRQDIEEIQRAYFHLQDVMSASLPLEVPTEKIENPVVRMELGRFLCFFQGDWEKGLPLLAESNDREIRTLAKLDLAPSSSTKQMMQCGDGWWERSLVEKSTVQRTLRQRAVFWYKQALPKLKGFTRVRIEQTLLEIQNDS